MVSIQTSVKEIRADHISKRYGNKKLFSSFSFSFQPNHIYLFKGPSGCGKTTLLSLLSKEIKPDSGTVDYFGLSFKKDVDFFSEEALIFMELTAEENLGLITQDKSAIQKTLSLLGLEQQAKTKGILLSKGEASRLALGRMILQDKPVWFLDEPTGNLDEENAKLIFRILKQYSHNRIIIMASHDTHKDNADLCVVFAYQDGSFTLISKESEGERESEDISFLEPKRRKGIPLKSFSRFFFALFTKSAKPILLLFPVMILLSCLSFYSLSFLSNDGNRVFYNEMTSLRMNGMIVESEVPDSSLTSKGFYLNYDDNSYYAIYNSSNIFQFPKEKIECKKSNGIVIPNKMAKENNLSTGDFVSFSTSDGSLNCVVESVYQETETNLSIGDFQIQDETMISHLKRVQNPILLSFDLTLSHPEITIDSSTFCFRDFFLRKDSLSFIPVVLSAGKTNTISFWTLKEKYNQPYRYLLIGFVVLLFIAYYFLFGSLLNNFKNENLLFRFTCGNGQKGTGLVLMFFFLFFFASLAISTILSCSMVSFMNHAFFSFYQIFGVIPVFVLSFSTFGYWILIHLSLWCLINILGPLLSSFSLSKELKRKNH